MIAPKHLLYGVLAIIIGVVLAFGISGVLYHPLPITATERDYTPAPAPTVITTAPTVTVTPAQATADMSQQGSDTCSDYLFSSLVRFISDVSGWSCNTSALVAYVCVAGWIIWVILAFTGGVQLDW
jgi:hypothetical protein